MFVVCVGCSVHPHHNMMDFFLCEKTFYNVKCYGNKLKLNEEYLGIYEFSDLLRWWT